MAAIETGLGKVEVIASVETLAIYEQEFDGRDMIQDVFGKIEVSEEEDGIVLDFTRTNWTALARALWACERTADRTVPSFAEWSKGAEGLNLLTVNRDLGEVIRKGFFRASADAAAEQEIEA